MMQGSFITNIDLVAPHVIKRHHSVESERQVALENLIGGTLLIANTHSQGPLSIKIIVQDFNVCFDFYGEGSNKIVDIQIPVKALRKHVKDHFLVCEDIEEMSRTSSIEKIEMMDHARRAIHNEGAELIAHQFKEKVEIDELVARGLFI